MQSGSFCEYFLKSFKGKARKLRYTFRKLSYIEVHVLAKKLKTIIVVLIGKLNIISTRYEVKEGPERKGYIS